MKPSEAEPVRRQGGGGTMALADNDAIFVFDRFRLDPRARTLSDTASAALIPLSSRGFDLLHLLLQRHDRTVGKDDMLEVVWNGLAVEENNLAVQMSALRRALGTTQAGQPFIATISGRGYRFVAPVRTDAHAPPSLAPAEPVFAEPAPPPHRPPRRVWVPAAAFAALLLTVAVLVLRGGSSWFAVRPAPRLSLVVLPFRNLTGNQARDYLADAISDDLTTDLSHLPGSLIIARESADTYKGRAVRAQSIGRALNVRYLLEGSIAGDADTIQVNAQLIDADSGGHLWASRFDVPPGRLDAARDAIVRHLASTLDFTLVDLESARSLRDRPHNPDAVDLFLRARSALHHDESLDGLKQAQALLEQAVASAPGFGEALAELGMVLLRKVGNYDDPDEWTDHARARQVIERAVALAPRTALSITARGMLAWEDEQCEQAVPDFRLALSLEPDQVQARDGLAQCDRELGHMQALIDDLREMIRIDPAAPGSASRLNRIGFATLMLGRPQEALGWLDAAHAGIPATGRAAPPLGWQEWNLLYLIAARWQTNDHEGARQLYAVYASQWPRRTVWQMNSYNSRAVAALPGAAAFAGALQGAGMPLAVPEAADFAIPPRAAPIDGGDFDPTPLDLPGATRILTEDLRARLASTAPPLVLDVGRGAAVPAGAMLVFPPGVWGDPDRLLDQAASRAGSHAPLVVMGNGPLGSNSYAAALHLVSAGYRHVLWYRGGEQSWAAAGYPAQDRR